ncbi:hypothetical protein BDN72DRAFT_606749 [Pluteus cervinus]|uniref:Uncharacterized protein n=1 Tax=Pluteus cervinus TaxID=181527 RepID=A0ACD3BB42_9AGAR|nr:hypothetical protein BDN72DRAFT_606749 [Pluteus cervinus]
MLFSFALSAVVLASSVFGSPLQTRSQCASNLAAARLTLPAQEAALAPPSTGPSGIVLGVGVQNYTCTAAGNYTTAGAVAQLFDISCLINKSSFDDVQDVAYDLWKKAPESITTLRLGTLINQIGHGEPAGLHYFISNSAGGISPKWDHTASATAKGKAGDFVVAKKVGDIPAPNPSADVDWLSLANVSGDLAAQVFRVSTRGGVAPAKCTPGSPLISVKYTSKYYYFGDNGF